MSRFVMLIMWFIAVVGLTFAGVRFSGLLDSMLPPGEPEITRFSPEMTLPAQPNFYLVCGGGHCPPAIRKVESPVFPVSAAQLFSRIEELAAGMGGKVTFRNGETLHIRFVVRSPIFRFPDWVDLQASPVEDNTSQLLAYSRSVYGADDFGANEKRLKKFIAQLSALTTGARASQ
ncbi:DUF1499 domain-containing protein [Thalassospira marina]|uniref:DUF1499 domain-containing protein n=1 Tax=Thalassospira marina TaxID=2048283 RepID=A0A2N3KM54_9PROT|nr:DUF1499 domain-containing protein [Thalassospira marina]PKR51638.1 hypothetical protein COO20_18845 [Thalassospira marina]